MKTLLAIVVFATALQALYPPQVLVNRATGKQVAIYDLSTQTVTITKLAPADLKVCMQDQCKTVAAWTR